MVTLRDNLRDLQSPQRKTTGRRRRLPDKLPDCPVLDVVEEQERGEHYGQTHLDTGFLDVHLQGVLSGQNGRRAI